MVTTVKRSRRLLSSLFLASLLLIAGVGVAGAENGLVESISIEGGGAVVKIKTDGNLEHTMFKLTGPERVVVDIPGASLDGVRLPEVSDNQYILGISATTYGTGKERIGRVVIATKGEVNHDISLGDESISVNLSGGSVDDLVAALEGEGEEGGEAAAPANPCGPSAGEAAAKAPADLVEVERVDYKRMKDRGRLIIGTTGSVPYTVDESEDGLTLAIDIHDTVIPARLERALDATGLNTPVSKVSSYQLLTDPNHDVRVLVELVAKVSYDMKEIGGAIVVDFPREIPVLVEEEEVEEEIDEENLPDHAVLQVNQFGEKSVYVGEKIDLDMVDAEVTDVLRLLAEVSNLNIIASDEVTGTISLRLKNVPWDQAFDLILKTQVLDKVQEGNIVRVAPADKIRDEREAFLAAKNAQEDLEDLKMKFIPINFASAQSLESQLSNVLSDRGTVSSEARTNTLIIKDIQSGIDDAMEIVKILDTAIPQVLIEARIVEAETSFARDLGIQWGLSGQGTSGGWNGKAFGSMDDTNMPGSGTKNFIVGVPASGNAGTLGAMGFSFGRMGSNPISLDIRLTAGEKKGLIKTISRPRITTLDNTEAVIKQGERIPFETTSAAGTSTTFVDAELSLSVTPHITPGGSVLLNVKATRNSIGTFRTAEGEPSINTKEASTQVIVMNGETTVIGGIVITDESKSEAGIPFLKSLPLVGKLFNSTSKSNSQKELLIFITPYVIKDNNHTNNDISPE